MPKKIDDVADNVCEWVAENGAVGQVAPRGGGWGNNPYCPRASYRRFNLPDIWLDMVGFRCAAEAG